MRDVGTQITLEDVRRAMAARDRAVVVYLAWLLYATERSKREVFVADKRIAIAAPRVNHLGHAARKGDPADPA